MQGMLLISRYWERIRLAYHLKKTAKLFSAKFLVFIQQQYEWEVTYEPKNKSEWHKVRPGIGRPYYIRFTGPFPFWTAVYGLLCDFINKTYEEAGFQE